MGNEMCFTEQRKFTRIPFNTEIRITAGDRTLICNALKDISMGGAFIFSNESFPEHTACCMDISLIGPASLLQIQIEAEIIRVDENGMAVEFTKIDLDGLIHLHHFIKVHSQNPEDIEQEFKSNFLEAE